jgi:hypothetical protein
MLPPCCHHLRCAATAVAALPPPLPCCRCRHRSAAAAAATLMPCCMPTPNCHRPIQRRHCAASTTLALPTPPPHCPPLPRRCLCRSAGAATAHPTLPPHFCRRCRAAAVATALPLPLLPPCNPAFPLLTAAELPQLPSPPPLRCQRRPRAADASAALPAATVLLPPCLQRSANAATPLPLLTPCCRCRASIALLPCCFC